MTPAPLPAKSTSLLLHAHAEYRSQVSPHYDEVLNEVTERIRQSGSIGKADIGSLVLWKRVQANTRWASQLLVMSEAEVRAITGRAVALAQNLGLHPPDAGARAGEVLRELPGCRHRPVLASALLVAAAPMRLAVYDRRVEAGLVRLSLEHPAGSYRRYLETVERLREDVAAVGGKQWSARDVDLALWWLGG